MQRFPHSKCYRTFVECLVSLDCHLNLVSNSNQQEASLSAVNGYLSYELVEGLGIEFFSDQTDTRFTSLSLLQLLIQLILQINDINAGCRGGGDILDPQLPCILVLSRRKNGVQVVLCPHLIGISVRPVRGSTCLLGGNLSSDGGVLILTECFADQNWRIIFY